VRFWDSSAIVPLLVAEPSSALIRARLGDDPEIVVCWATEIECVSAIARRERSGALLTQDVDRAMLALDELAESWSGVPPSQRVRQGARRIVRVHDLRAADALQLAAAWAASDEQPGRLPFVTLDERLALAASREGFSVVGLG